MHIRISILILVGKDLRTTIVPSPGWTSPVGYLTGPHSHAPPATSHPHTTLYSVSWSTTLLFAQRKNPEVRIMISPSTLPPYLITGYPCYLMNSSDLTFISFTTAPARIQTLFYSSPGPLRSLTPHKSPCFSFGHLIPSFFPLSELAF